MNKRRLSALVVFAGFVGWRAYQAPVARESTAVSAPTVTRLPPATPTPVAAAPVTASRGSSTMTKFAFPKELSTYVFLHQKIFLSDAEKAQRDELLHHAALLRALGARLREPTRLKEGMNEQDAAIDLLIEAARVGDRKVANEVLREVVRDGQIENRNLARPEREQLAGLKAEVLYQWTATNPDGDIPSLLPGPVSKKIWANVLAMQESNRAESMATAERDLASARGGQ